MTDRELTHERVLRNQARLMTCLRLPQAQGLLSLDLTMTQFKSLALLEADGSATVGQLARALGVGLSTMTGVVDRLCDQGMVTRGEDPDDRRATRVRHTPLGSRTIERFNQIRREAFSQVLERLTDDELDLVAGATDVLASAAEAAARDADAGEVPALAGAER